MSGRVDALVGRFAVFGPLRRPRFRRLVTAQFVSEIGDGITTVALPLYVLARTGSAIATSLTFMAELLAGVLFGIVGGALADGLDRQRVLMASYAVRAALLVGAVVAEPLPVVIALGVLARAGGQLDNPSFDAMVPEHADGDLQQVLALRRFVQAISYTIGPAVGAIAVTLAGPRRALLLDSVTFIVALALLAPLRGLDGTVAERRRSTEGQSIGERLRTTLDGVVLVVRTPMLNRLILYISLAMAAVAVVMAAAVIWYEQTLNVSGAWYGIAISAYGIGSTIGLVWAGSRTFHRPLAVVLLLAAPVYAAASGIGVVALVPWLLPIGWLVWGTAMGPEMVLSELLVVASVADEVRGRVFAALGVLATLGLAVGYGVAGPLIETIGSRATIAWTSVVVLALGAMWIGPARRSTPPAGVVADGDHVDPGDLTEHPRPVAPMP